MHQLLKKYYEKKRRSAPGYSLRQLAERLEVSHTFLSRVLSGKKLLPFRLLIRLAPLLDIEAEVLEALRQTYIGEMERPRTSRQLEASTALDSWNFGDRKNLKALRHWYYPPIMDLTLLPSFDGTEAMIADRLRLSATEVEIAVRELISMGLLRRVKGALTKTSKKLRLGSATSQIEIRSFHSQMLHRAQAELQATTPVDFARRLITGLTITVAERDVPEAKKRISEFLHELANDLTAVEGEDVYQLGIQFFPLTKKS